MDLKRDLSGDLPDNLDGNARRLSHAFGRVGGVSKDQLNEGKAAARCLEQRHGAIAILDGRRMDLQCQGTTICIDHGVPLAALDLLACIIAAWAASLGGFHALTGDGAWIASSNSIVI
jgi:hypothetical protein